MRVTGSSVTASPHAGTMDTWMSVLWRHGSGLCVSQQRGLWKLLTVISQVFMRLQDKLSCCIFYSGVVCGTWLWCYKHTLIIKLTYYSMLSLLWHILDGQPSNRALLSLCTKQHKVKWSCSSNSLSSPESYFWVKMLQLIAICFHFPLFWELVCVCVCVRMCVLVIQSYLTLCKPTHCSMPGFPVLHYLPELSQIHVHWFGDAIQSSHPLQPPSPFAFDGQLLP